MTDIVLHTDANTMTRHLKTRGINLSRSQIEYLVKSDIKLPSQDLKNFLKRNVPWTLRQWLYFYRPRCFIFNWEGIVIPEAFVSYINSLGFMVDEVIKPESTNKVEVFREWVQWWKTNKQDETWVIYYHGGNKNYFDDLLDFNFELTEFNVWKSSGVLFCMRIEGHLLDEFNKYIEESEGFIFAVLNNWMGYKGYRLFLNSLYYQQNYPLTYFCLIVENDRYIDYLKTIDLDIHIFPNTPIHTKVIQTQYNKDKELYSLQWDYNLYYSSLYIEFLRTCLHNKVPFVFIFHQDLSFVKGYKKKINDVWNLYVDKEWDIIVLSETKYAWNAAIINNTAYNEIIRLLEGKKNFNCINFWEDLYTLRIVFRRDVKIFLLKPNTFFEYLTVDNLYANGLTCKELVNDDDYHVYTEALKSLKNIQKNTCTPHIPKKLYILSEDCLTLESWKNKYSSFDIAVINPKLNTYVFPDYPQWSILSQTEIGEYLLPFMLLYHFGGIIVSNKTPCFRDVYSEASTKLVFYTQTGVRISSDIMIGEDKNVCIKKFLDFVIRGHNNTENSIDWEDYLSCVLVSVLKRDVNNSFSILDQNPERLITPVKPAIKFPFIFPKKLKQIKHIDVCMLVQNNYEYLETFFWSAMRQIQKDLHDIHLRLFFYENNSDDNTVVSILRKRNEFDIVLFKQDLTPFLKIDRIIRLGKIRNFFMKKLTQYYLERKDITGSPYVMLIDSDVIFKTRTFIEVINQIALNPDAAMVGANIKALDNIYYDFLALDYGYYYQKGERTIFERILNSHNHPVHPVKTIFGGITVFYKELLFFCSFGDSMDSVVGVTADIRCEHYKFCKEIQKWGKIYIAKDADGYWIPNWRKESHKLMDLLKENNYLSK
jgi:hypothetical protein